MIQQAHRTATAWKAYDPEANQASERIRTGAGRYGIDVNNTGAVETSVSAVLTRAQQARTEAENEQTKAAAARTDEAVAGAAVSGANRQDSVAQRHRTHRPTTHLSGGRNWLKASKARETGKRSTPAFGRTNRARRLRSAWRKTLPGQDKQTDETR